ncbi:MAG: phage major capsid protein [Gemmatimonadaceae bacterium]|nr:phage major capsid protein [Gemmatimonadaceae bacterium]
MSTTPRPDALPTQYRTLTISRDTLATRAEGDDRIPIALSSEAPVERWFGTEILDHTRSAIDLTRAEGGLPLLVDHDTGDQVGLIEDVTLDSDRVLRGMMRFSKSARGQEIKQDVEDGIRTNASIGYQIRELVLEKSDKQGGDTYRALRWTPLEGSIVAVPADPSVGVNRSAADGAVPVIIRTPSSTAAEARELPMSDKDTAANAAAPNVEVRERAVDTRAADLAALAKQFNAAERLGEWITSGKSVDAARQELLERISANARPMTAPVVELTEAEQKRYSVKRAIAAMVGRQTGERYEDDGFEREVSESIAKNLPDYKSHGGIMVPTNLRVDPKQANAVRAFLGMATRAGLDSKTATKGPEGVFAQQGEFIDLLRARAKVFAMGARSLAGLVGPVTFPKQTGAGTFTMVGENPGADVAESNLLLGTVALSPKTGQSTTSVSKQLIAQQSIDVDALIRDDLAMIHSLGLDSQALNGDGTGNNCTGILNTAGIGSVAAGANGAQPTWGNIVDLETAVAVANADVENMGYLTTPAIRGRLKQTTKLANSIAQAIWDGGQVNGYRAEVSTQVPSNLVKGTSGAVCHAILFGDYSQAVVGQWGAFEIVVDPYRLKKQGMIELTSFQMFGVAVRQAAAFAAIKDALQ